MARTPWLAYPPARGPRQLLQLALVGVACWPANLLDRSQDALLHHLPAFGNSWDRMALALLLAPLWVMPVLLVLQARLWPEGVGPGIPQLMVALQDPERTEELMAPAATVQRLVLWSIATLALLPLGREGPIVHVGGAVLVALRRRFPGLLSWLGAPERLAMQITGGRTHHHRQGDVGLQHQGLRLAQQEGADEQAPDQQMQDRQMEGEGSVGEQHGQPGQLAQDRDDAQAIEQPFAGPRDE